MQIPVLTLIALIFILWLNYEIHTTSSKSKKALNDFLKREKEANFSRSKDITDLDYIIISTETLPLKDNSDDTINSYRNTIVSLSGKKAINLRDFTNTELKLKYGAANLKQLTEYDSNYITLISILQKWAERLYIQGSFIDCIAVLEYATACYCDVIKTYKLLAKLYQLQKTPEKINHLIELIPHTKLQIQAKEKLIEALKLSIHS